MQEFLHNFYQELVDEGKHETKNTIVILKKGGLVIRNKFTGEEVTLTV